MVDRGGGGSIVNISSVASTRALDEHIAYCTSKSAVDSITRVMALELGKHKVPLYKQCCAYSHTINTRYQYIYRPGSDFSKKFSFSTSLISNCENLLSGDFSRISNQTSLILS